MKNWNFLLLLFLGLSTVTFTACNDDDDDTTPDTSTLTIAEIAADDDQFSTLVGALQRVDLVEVLNGTGSFTVFAPTNDAFDRLGVDLSTLTDAQLTDILLYHVLGGAIASTDLMEGQTYASTASTGGPNGTSPSALIERAGANVTINGDISVTTADINASNGIIHVIDNVMLPMDVVKIATSNSNFSQLVSALGAANGDLVSVLSGNGPFTVFAPVNAAFQEIAGTVAGLDADQLASVLTYHVASGNVRAEDLTDNMEVTSVQTEKFTINLGDPVTITDANGNTSEIILTNVQGTNGVVHVINKVILPQNL